jgi:hypothetical protein
VCVCVCGACVCAVTNTTIGTGKDDEQLLLTDSDRLVNLGVQFHYQIFIHYLLYAHIILVNNE